LIDLYTWTTPNGRKVSIMLEEIGLPYRVIPVDISKGEQHESEFLNISPNNKIPAILDHDNGRSMMESGAILLYLGQKAGRLIPQDDDRYWQMMEWLMMQMGSIGPMLGQTHHFVKFNPGKAPYAEERYLAENRRIYHVLDSRLAGSEFLVDDYSIADIACWPWISRFEWQQMDLDEYPNLKRWYLEIASRPAVVRGYHVPAKANEIPMPPGVS
jgi:GST-like protein